MTTNFGTVRGIRGWFIVQTHWTVPRCGHSIQPNTCTLSCMRHDYFFSHPFCSCAYNKYSLQDVLHQIVLIYPGLSDKLIFNWILEKRCAELTAFIFLRTSSGGCSLCTWWFIIKSSSFTVKKKLLGSLGTNKCSRKTFHLGVSWDSPNMVQQILYCFVCLQTYVRELLVYVGLVLYRTGSTSHTSQSLQFYSTHGHS